jgi:predicted TIM-barrel fold metal-dependent hydrolase
MHGAYPHLDDMTRLLDDYPQVCVGASFTNPKSEAYLRYLKGLVEAGYGDRIMFGSDQMVWPELIGDFAGAIESAGFLTDEQKRAIFYENAARFFDLEGQEGGGPQR